VTRRNAFASIVALVVCSACPKPAGTPVPVPSHAQQADEGRVVKLAQILRAADRRVVDDPLRAAAADADPTVRARAAAAMGQIGDAAAVPLLEKILHDADASVRAAAAVALGLIAEPASRESLHAAVADTDPGVRGAAVEALGRLHDESSVADVSALLNDPDMVVRAQAALAAWKFVDPATLLDGLIGDLAAPDPRLRAAAAYTLARLASAPTAPPSSGALVGRLSSSDLARARAALAVRVGDVEPEVRMQVARGLARPEGGPEVSVVGTLSADKDPRVRVNALRALSYPGMPVHPYIERAVKSKDPYITRTALEALGKICGGTATEMLKTLMVAFDDRFRREAVLTSLTQCVPDQIPAVVSGLLQNPDPVMRAAAVPLIAGHHEAGARQAAKLLLGDSDPSVVAVDVPVAADEDGPIGPLLGPAPGAPDPIVRAAAADAYGARLETPRPGTEPRDVLLTVLEGQWDKAAADTLPDARLSVLDAAAKAGKDERAHALLVKGLADRDVVVRRRAAGRLGEVYGENRAAEVGPASDRPLEDYEAIIRWSAVRHAAIVTLSRPGFLPGRFTIALDGQAAPLNAWNFAQLADKKFYDARIVHRVVPNFVVQDGDPRGDGHGGPGYSIRDEFNALRFTAGAVGMASDGKDTAGSQWFVTLSDQPHLDGRYTAFGQVVQGLRDVVGTVLPGDTVVSIRVYEGNGTEPLPKN
jgi:cyclophilin family peptidyl-prolyl cis-trans isomerase/HEAT repeat protein